MTMRGTVVVDTEEARRERQASHERARNVLRTLDDERPRFPNVMAMLSWYYAMREHMTGAPAIDPSREQLQGVTVDRDERIAWVGKVGKALLDLAVSQEGPHDVALLELHFRVPRENGTHVVEGRRLTKWTEGSVRINELWTKDVLKRSQKRCAAAFWAALEELETKALNRRWVAGRVERKTRAPEVYRRGETSR